MKSIKITTSNKKKVEIPQGCFNSDFFKCTNTSCEYHDEPIRMLVLGNTATCSKCGSRMNRI